MAEGFFVNALRQKSWKIYFKILENLMFNFDGFLFDF